MSATYIGKTDRLIQMAGDSITVNPSRLAVLGRSYACIPAFVEKARSILSPGYRPPDYPLMGLFSKPQESKMGPLVTFICQFYGVLSFADYLQPKESRMSNLHTLTVNTVGTGTYVAPELSRVYVVSADSTARAPMPSVSDVANDDEGNVIIYNFGSYKRKLTFNEFGQEYGNLVTYVTPTALRKQNFGIVDEITEIWSFSTNNG
jgi:hypothetical protein